MKRLFLSVLFSAILILGFNQNVLYAAIYTFVPPVPDMYDLDHGEAYEWGINQNLGPGEIITHASMQFDNINDWTIESNDRLYVRLFQSATSGITIYTDNQAQGDYFAGRGTRLFTYRDHNQYWYWNDSHTQKIWVNPPEDYTYYFSRFEIRRLNRAIRDGNFGFGFDPDCHYYNDGIEFKIITKLIPEPTTLSLLGLGLLGLIRFRKRKV